MKGFARPLSLVVAWHQPLGVYRRTISPRASLLRERHPRSARDRFITFIALQSVSVSSWTRLSLKTIALLMDKRLWTIDLGLETLFLCAHARKWACNWVNFAVATSPPSLLFGIILLRIREGPSWMCGIALTSKARIFAP